MTDNWTVQASYKFGNGHMLNVRAGNVTEFAELLGQVEKGLERIIGVGDITAAVTAAAPITQAAPAPAPVAPATPWTPPPAAPAAEPAASGRMCAHGAMVQRNGVSARGPWSGWFCPLPKGDPNQCKAVFNR